MLAEPCLKLTLLLLSPTSLTNLFGELIGTIGLLCFPENKT